VIAFREDILKKMGKGKIVTQGAHASLGSLKNVNKKILEKWERRGAKKVVLKVKNLRDLKRLYKKIKNKKLPCFMVRDAGRTQIRKGTITCLSIGPAKEEDIDKITGKLKLL